MIVMYRKTLITKVLLVIIIKPPFFQKEGRHSTIEHSLYNYKNSYINKKLKIGKQLKQIYTFA